MHSQVCQTSAMAQAAYRRVTPGRIVPDSGGVRMVLPLTEKMLQLLTSSR